MKDRKEMRLKRKLRIRVKVTGTAARPRLAIFRSNRNISGQLIDDEKGITILAKHMSGKSTKEAKVLGAELAAAARDKKITTVVFDRGGFRYHGVVKTVADAAREGGLKF